MRISIFLTVLTSFLIYSCNSLSQPKVSQEALMDVATNLAIQKFQNSSCEELSQMKSQQTSSGPSAVLEKKAIEMLRNNPEIRQEFIDRVAGTILNKMFDCELIP